MNIGFTIPTMYRGGAERAMSIICNAMVERGHQVVLMLTEDANDIKNDLDERIKVVDITNQGKIYVARIPRYVKSISKVVRENKIDMLVSFIVRTNIQTIMAGRLTRTPVIVSERNDPYTIPHSGFSKKLRDIMYQYADGFVFQTRYAKEYFSKSIQDRSVIIYNPTSKEIENLPSKIKKEDVIITASRLDGQKNISMLIDAFKKIEPQCPTYRVEIYGAGQQGDLQNKIDETGLHEKIKLMGMADDVIMRMARSKIFVLSSNFEGFSNALVEAMCAGTACVATDAPTYGNREIIKDGDNGFLISVGDTEKLAEKMLQLINNPDIMECMGVQAKNIYSITNRNVIADQWEQYIIQTYNNYTNMKR